MAAAAKWRHGGVARGVVAENRAGSPIHGETRVRVGRRGRFGCEQTPQPWGIKGEGHAGATPAGGSAGGGRRWPEPGRTTAAASPERGERNERALGGVREEWLGRFDQPKPVLTWFNQVGPRAIWSFHNPDLDQIQIQK